MYKTIVVEELLTFSCTKYKAFIKSLTFIDSNNTWLKVLCKECVLSVSEVDHKKALAP